MSELIHGDCLEVMQSIPDKSVDMILCDLPYGTTDCKWDVVIPFKDLWDEYRRIIKDKGAIVLTAREPFTSALVMSNVKYYRHKWVWNKKQTGNPFLAKYMPLQIEEDVLVFGFNSVKYYPQMREGKMRIKGGGKSNLFKINKSTSRNDTYYPVNIIEFNNCSNKQNKLHVTQKPVELFKYLIKTYTNENETVLDNCSGSGTTAIACLETNRNYICIEKDKTYYDLSVERINKHQANLFKEVI